MTVAVAILVVSLLIVVHEAGHFGAARALGMRVLRVSLGFGPALVSFRSSRSGIVFQISAVPLGGFVQIRGTNPTEPGAAEDPKAYVNHPPWRRALVTLAGPLSNLATAWAILFGLGVAGSEIPIDEPRIGIVESGGPADRAGLKPGDEILRVDGKPVSSFHDIVSEIRARPGRQIALLLRRGEREVAASVRADDVRGKGRIGVGPTTVFNRLPPHRAALHAAARCGIVLAGTVGAIAEWARGSGDVEAMGPVGIVSLAADTLSSGAREFLSLVAYLSLMLFLFNMLPVPALDGGRLLFLAIEVIARRPPNRRVEAAASTIGFLALVGLLVAMTVKEIFFE